MGIGTLLAALALMAGAAQEAASVDAGLIWIEGEAAAERQVHANAGFEAVDADELSGGGWLANFSEAGEPDGRAVYRFEVPEAGEYRLWARVASAGTGYSWQLDDGPAQTIDLEALRKADGLIQETPIARDASWDHRRVAWVDLGTADLSAGAHSLAIVLGGSDAEQRFGAVDAIVLAAGDWRPNGKFRPGQDWQDLVQFAPDETWAFEPQRDSFSDDALLDLRGLNEAVAGEHGFIRRSEDGNDFVRGDGEPIRFWAGTTYVQRNTWGEPDGMARLEHHARFLAKRGINIVRYHSHLPATDPGAPLSEPRDEVIDQTQRLVAAMKKAGIYTIYSPYWGSHTKYNPAWGIADPDNANLAGLVFFDPDVQAAYKNWLRELLTRPNPYTGIALKDDPALAIIQLQNEDSMLFFTMQRVGGQQLINLRRLFAKFVIAEHGSLAAAREAWQGYAHPDDNWDDDLPGLFIVWEFTGDARRQKGGEPGREERLADQFEFIARTMYDFNAEIRRFLTEDIGARQLVNAGNWRTADPPLMDDAERFAYSAAEVMGKNHYYGGQHKGLNVGYQIRAGQAFTNPSATQNPTRLPLNIKQPEGHPFIIPESLWVPPIRYQAEGPLMVAAQSSLVGLDGFYWFATGHDEWQPVGNKWTFATPMQQGQFPAAALLHRLGYVAEGEPVVVEHRSLDDIWHRRTPIIAEGRAYDPNRDVGDMPVDAPVQSPVDPLAFLVGPVRVVYGSDASKSFVADLSPYIDRDAGTVRSNTGQIDLDYGLGLYRVNAPKAQAAAGFLAQAGAVELADVTIDCHNAYASIVVVPLDDQPLATSGKVLVQVGTVTRPTGWKARPAKFEASGQRIDGFRIVEVGENPWQIEKTRATVTVRNGGLAKATLLDINGMAVREVPVSRDGDAITVELPPETMYLVLQ